MMMKRIFTNQFLCAMLFFACSAQAQDNFFISEVTDPGDDYSGRFIELYNAGSEAIEFNTTTCYLSRQSNGGTSWGDLQLSGTVAAGSTFVIGGSGFEALYGFAPDQVSGILIGNGDDAYALFLGGNHETGVLHDILGVIDVDGTGEPWEYEDSRALRQDAVLVPNASWDATEWEITAADVADCNPGTHLGSVVEPPGDFALTLLNDTVTLGQAVELPVSVSELTAVDNIISYQFDISFDPLVLTYTGFSLTGTMAEGGNVVVNDGVGGRLSVGYMHTTPLVGTGDILLLQFNSLGLDTTDLLISNAYLNSTAVTDLQAGTVIITEVAPPTAAITYSDTINRFADTLLITATFSEVMHAGNPVLLHLDGTVSLADLEMVRLSETLYSYTFPIPKANGEVALSLSNGTDLWGKEVVASPTTGGTFSIIAFRPGDVDDDGVILAYDAALTLQYSVGIDPLPGTDPMPWEYWRDSTANVDGSGGITAYDAGMILQYSAGIISSFSSPALKSTPVAGVGIEMVDQHLLFRSHGELLGLNINTTNEHGLLGTPEVLKEEFMSAINMDGKTYRIGLCTASSPTDGDALLKIPFSGSGTVTFQIIENAEERVVKVDLLTGMYVSELSQIEIYPNPVVDMLLISGLSGPAFVGIYNIHGQVLLTAHTEGNRGEIDLSNLPGGLYMIMFEMGKETVTRKFLKR
jgi:hypothetical protein